jgi:hypothetical protein
VTSTGVMSGLPHPRRLLDLGPHDGAHRVALRAGLAVGIPLVILWSIGRIDLSLYTTFGAFTSFYGRSHTHLTRARLQATVAGAQVLAVAIGAVVAVSPDRTWLAVPVTAVYAGVVTLVSNVCGWRPAGSLFAVFALSASASLPGGLEDAALATALTAASAGLALLIGVLGLMRPGARQRAQSEWGIDPVKASRRRAVWEDVARTAVVVGLAGAVPTALGLGYPYWAMVAAAASVSGQDVTSRFVRAGHRMVGTFLGVGIAAVILFLAPPVLLTIAILCVLQMCAELFVVRNYGLALIFVTPLALVMVALAHPLDPSALLRDRLVETAIGVAVVIAFTLVEHLGSRRRMRG